MNSSQTRQISRLVLFVLKSRSNSGLQCLRLLLPLIQGRRMSATFLMMGAMFCQSRGCSWSNETTKRQGYVPRSCLILLLIATNSIPLYLKMQVSKYHSWQINRWFNNINKLFTRDFHYFHCLDSFGRIWYETNDWYPIYGLNSILNSLAPVKTLSPGSPLISTPWKLKDANSNVVTTEVRGGRTQMRIF